MKKIFYISFILLVFLSCTTKIEKVEKAFYYWKSDNSAFNENEEHVLDTLKVKKVYLKFFEVKYDETLGMIPFSKTKFNKYSWFDDSKKQELNVIPTVFIKNEVFIKGSKAQIDTLVNNVNHLVKKYFEERFEGYPNLTEIQIDCDWTLKSKENYFYFLESFGNKSKLPISCTLRLYPYKYRTKMGIPPVKKVTLMCYNLIQPFDDKNKNSILDTNELKSYLSVVDKYPVHLDVALPLFSWGHLYRYDTFKKFINLNKQELESMSIKKNKLWYDVVKDTVIKDFFYRKGDKIKFENIDSNLIHETISLLKKEVSFDKEITVTFFHLDDKQLEKFNYETITSYYISFSK
ncbi:hypothetical protein [Flavobacterium sp.]|uniref:hypothetical protein n=1 Tax=Flavobacterium sp. TaxID=239 RepID=UPI004047DBEC